MAVDVFTDYLEHAFASDEALATQAQRVIPEDVEYDTMIGRGMSGALIIPRLATLLGKAYAIVRKDNDGSHSGNRVEGRIGSRWIFVDEFTRSGRTRKMTIEAVQSYADKWNQETYFRSYRKEIKTEYIGSYLYRDRKFQRNAEWHLMEDDA